MLTTEAIAEFKKIYERKFGKKISNETALEMATELIELWRVIYRPVPKNKPAENNKSDIPVNMKITGK